MLQLLHKVKFILQNMNNYFNGFIKNTKELVAKIFHRGQNQLILSKFITQTIAGRFDFHA